MRTGTLQMTLHTGDIALGQWWSGTRRDATALLRRHLPELAASPRELADLLDGEATLVVVRVGQRTAAAICADAEVRTRAASLATTLMPSDHGIRRAPIAARRAEGKVEAA